MPRACGMLVCFRGFVEKIIKIYKKIIWTKTVAIHIVLKEKTTKIILEKIITKKNERKKNHVGKHFNNL